MPMSTSSTLHPEAEISTERDERLRNAVGVVLARTLACYPEDPEQAAEMAARGLWRHPGGQRKLCRGERAPDQQGAQDVGTGRIANPSLAEYHVPAHLDVPEIDVMWTDIPDPHTPMGARGVGEIGITGVGAAVANAVFNATGKRIRDLPITLDKLLMAPSERL